MLINISVLFCSVMHHWQDIEVIMCTSQIKITYTHIFIFYCVKIKQKLWFYMIHNETSKFILRKSVICHFAQNFTHFKITCLKK